MSSQIRYCLTSEEEDLIPITRQDDLSVYEVAQEKFGGGNTFANVRYVVIQDLSNHDTQPTQGDSPSIELPDCIVHTYSPVDSSTLAEYSLSSHGSVISPQYYTRETYENARCLYGGEETPSRREVPNSMPT